VTIVVIKSIPGILNGMHNLFNFRHTEVVRYDNTFSINGSACYKTLYWFDATYSHKHETTSVLHVVRSCQFV